ncbi:probable ATP-dependent RNA helicase DDX56 isoform X2 [Schistocerca gregaria]|uniref:probable ATP-dependent RNA helicase DDX56 isoform X2 n=1 Tax=Schistocerca gregaria TaxID=7010 RepID=UPI00211F2920|nr:probable ATP-dependent RNA helicase DDX56 isoform X2 [Schistocerca gregaria]
MEEESDHSRNFHEMELDDRILKAIAKQGWEKPTLIQEKAIPLLLEGKDVLIRARTGSGKTGAFAIPAIQKILNSKLVAREQAVKCLILAPSKELCHQIYTNILQLTIKCSREVTCVDISAPVDLSAQQSLLTERPDIVVATPSRALAHLKAGNIDLKKSLEVLVIDEADLVFSFGYEDELKQIFRFLPRIYQATLASATLSEDVLSLKKLVLHNAVTLKLEESELAPATQLSHYHLAAEEEDKAAILYALLKLHLIRGKTVIFVNSVDRCYRLKLFLEQFGIPTCVLNSELPANVRCHSVNQYNNGVYDVIIASDEKALEEPHELKEPKKKSKRKKDKESGVSRGIDFQYVSNVINFDFPLDVNSYIHRAGRTARGTNQGTALSFVSIKERPLMQEVEQFLQKSCGDNNNILKAYQFKLEQVEGFRYRAKDAWRAVTRIAVREARLKEIKQEILNSQKLKSYFVDNPRDLQTLRHDKALHTVKIQPHLADVPDYIVPDALKQLSRVGTSRKKNRLGSSRNNLAGVSKAKAKYEAKKANPLKSMEFFGFKKRKTS